MEQRRRCVACGFNESMGASAAAAVAVPRARFERSRTTPVDHQPVKILDPSFTHRNTSKGD
jgi:hypothetical protein